MEDQHMNNVVALILFFVFVALFMVFCKQIGVMLKSRRALKYAKQIKVGGVITRKIPKPENPPMPLWANKFMENRVTGEILPVCADHTGFWHFPKGSDPVNLSLREWMIKNE